MYMESVEDYDAKVVAIKNFAYIKTPYKGVVGVSLNSSTSGEKYVAVRIFWNIYKIVRASLFTRTLQEEEK